MLFVLTRSGIEVMRAPKTVTGKEKVSNAVTVSEAKDREYSAVNGLQSRLVQRMALMQAVLAIMAATSYHVQIITRLSSGYPVWYWWLARQVLKEPGHGFGRNVVVFMVMYALIQGALYASFLPPA